MSAFWKPKIKLILHKSRLSAVMVLLTGSLVYAGVLISARYNLSIPVLANGGADMASPNYKIQTGTLGQGVSGNAQSSNYQNSGGFADQARAMANPPALNLSDAYVYPNPFKPNSPGSFQASEITFAHLPAEATIRIFAITGRQVAELHKTNRTVDDYKWNATNSDGQKLASGVYLYFITSPGGGKAKGKFAVIR
ncbi:MAG: hypothetical protein A2021_02780 [Elusimicrobia bacterium GWF2_52_66]|nr:MAG: hypothetical protein A2021_02780 [Elusimicrobia bacterium GWF2_52_66]HAF95963.1 hypothetical protein [Elusimicrobiota bacterium]HCE99086.1 hypothetical protein [Elusimicrobiota bacterium]